MTAVETLLAEAANKAVGHHADCSCCKRIAQAQVVALREWLLSEARTRPQIAQAIAIAVDLMDGAPMEESPCPKHRALGVNPTCPDCDHADLMDGDA